MKWLFVGTIVWALATTASAEQADHLAGLPTVSVEESIFGIFRFANSATTPITVDGSLMPIRGVEQFNFAIFFAPDTTVDAPNQMASFTDPAFQTAHAYNTNSVSVAGRLSLRSVVTLADPQFPAFSYADFVIRGWSVSAGATWEEALANWNNGMPLTPMSIGSSVVGNHIWLVTDLTPEPVFAYVPGFNLVTIPEPSTYALLGMSVVTLWLLRRRSP